MKFDVEKIFENMDDEKKEMIILIEELARINNIKCENLGHYVYEPEKKKKRK